MFKPTGSLEWKPDLSTDSAMWKHSTWISTNWPHWMAGMFQGLVAVTNLYLYNNQINSIEDNTFANMKKLEKISLYANDLESLESRNVLRIGISQGVTPEWESFKDIVSGCRWPPASSTEAWVTWSCVSQNPWQSTAVWCWIMLVKARGTTRNNYVVLLWQSPNVPIQTQMCRRNRLDDLDLRWYR